MSDLYRPRLLHDIDRDGLAELAANRRWPKWSTMCHLHWLGLPVLNAVCVPPQHAEDLPRAAALLASATSATRLMVRSDGGIETRDYYRGGNSYPLDEVVPHATMLLADGRAILLLEPTNRFINRLTVLLRMDRDTSPGKGAFTIEALGAGYDVGDLTRGGIHPQVRLSMNDVNWRCYAKPWLYDFRVTRFLHRHAEQKRRTQRLERLATHLPGNTGADAERWLRARGYTSLWDGSDPTMRVLRAAPAWFDAAFGIAMTHPNRDWRCLATAVSDLGDGRSVYWDVVDAAHKFGPGVPR
ncbi:hypothetical protein ACFWD1_29045 [Micromonospora chalcea]